MKKLFLKISVALLLIAVLVVPMLWQARTQAANEPEINPYDDPEMNLDAVRAKYHDDMNEMFNQHIALLVQQADAAGNDSQTIHTEAPENDDECYLPDTPNVSSYCVALKGTHAFLLYRSSLEKRRNAFGATGSQNAVVTGLMYRANLIDDEVVTARKTLDTAVHAYNEFRLAYPLHKEYERLIPTLQKYRDALKVIRDKVETFPSKFIDASSTTCG